MKIESISIYHRFVKRYQQWNNMFLLSKIVFISNYQLPNIIYIRLISNLMVFILHLKELFDWVYRNFWIVHNIIFFKRAVKSIWFNLNFKCILISLFESLLFLQWSFVKFIPLLFADSVFVLNSFYFLFLLSVESMRSIFSNVIYEDQPIFWFFSIFSFFL